MTCSCRANRDHKRTIDAMSLVWGRASVDRETGVVTWLGVRWHGVPYPARLWVCLREWAEVGSDAHRPSDFAGCGCVVRLKDWYESIDRWLAVRLLAWR